MWNAEVQNKPNTNPLEECKVEVQTGTQDGKGSSGMGMSLGRRSTQEMVETNAITQEARWKSLRRTFSMAKQKIYESAWEKEHQPSKKKELWCFSHDERSLDGHHGRQMHGAHSSWHWIVGKKEARFNTNNYAASPPCATAGAGVGGLFRRKEPIYTASSCIKL